MVDFAQTLRAVKGVRTFECGACDVIRVTLYFDGLLKKHSKRATRAITHVTSGILSANTRRLIVNELNHRLVLGLAVDGAVQAEAYYVNAAIHRETDTVTGARVAPAGFYLAEAIDHLLVSAQAAAGRVIESEKSRGFA